MHIDHTGGQVRPENRNSGAQNAPNYDDWYIIPYLREQNHVNHI